MPIPARIVVVDDQRLVRHTLRALLTQQPHWRIYEVESGVRALELVPVIHPHVVVIDLVMPEMNGVELAYELRRMEGAPKIILISSHYTAGEAELLARLFGDGNFVPKSEAGKLLLPAINRLLPEECQAKRINA
jgi:DNA-binding NarL/FixJ family response regulator